MGASEDMQLQLLKQVLESVHRGEGAEAEEDEVALHDPSAAAGKTEVPNPAESAGGAAATGSGPPPVARAVVEERLPLASLSGGLDGSYAVSAQATKQLRSKPLA